MSRTPPPVTATRIKDSLVVTAGSELSEPALTSIAEVSLAHVRAHAVRTVIFELSAVRVLDLAEFRELRAIQQMIRMLGAATVFVGLQPGVVLYLVEFEDDLSDVRAFLTLEDALDAFLLRD